MKKYNYFTIALLSAGLAVWPVVGSTATTAELNTATITGGASNADPVLLSDGTRLQQSTVKYNLPDGSSFPVNITTNGVDTVWNVPLRNGTTYQYKQSIDLKQKTITNSATMKLPSGQYQLADSADARRLLDPARTPGKITVTQTKPLTRFAGRSLEKLRIKDLFRTIKNTDGTEKLEAVSSQGDVLFAVDTASVTEQDGKRYHLQVTPFEPRFFAFDTTNTTDVAQADHLTIGFVSPPPLKKVATSVGLLITPIIIRTVLATTDTSPDVSSFSAQVKKSAQPGWTSFGIIRSPTALSQNFAGMTVDNYIFFDPAAITYNAKFYLNGTPTYQYTSALTKDKTGLGGELTTQVTTLTSSPSETKNSLSKLVYVPIKDYDTALATLNKTFYQPSTGAGTAATPLLIGGGFDDLGIQLVTVPAARASDPNGFVIMPQNKDLPSLKASVSAGGQVAFRVYPGTTSLADLEKSEPATRPLSVTKTAPVGIMNTKSTVAGSGTVVVAGGETLTVTRGNGTVLIGEGFGEQNLNTDNVIIGVNGPAAVTAATAEAKNVEGNVSAIDNASPASQTPQETLKDTAGVTRITPVPIAIEAKEKPKGIPPAP